MTIVGSLPPFPFLFSFCLLPVLRCLAALGDAALVCAASLQYVFVWKVEKDVVCCAIRDWGVQAARSERGYLTHT
jgi:hypothetical protein